MELFKATVFKFTELQSWNCMNSNVLIFIRMLPLLTASSLGCSGTRQYMLNNHFSCIKGVKHANGTRYGVRCFCG